MTKNKTPPITIAHHPALLFHPKLSSGLNMIRR